MEQLDWLPILVAAAAYWLLGVLWYSVLFGGLWSRGLEKQGVKLAKPSRGEMVTKFIGSFVANLVVVIAIAWLVDALHLVRFVGAVKLGLLLGVGVSGMALATSYSWESKPLTNLLVDASYHTVGPIVAAVIVLAWG